MIKSTPCLTGQFGSRGHRSMSDCVWYLPTSAQRNVIQIILIDHLFGLNAWYYRVSIFKEVFWPTSGPWFPKENYKIDRSDSRLKCTVHMYTCLIAFGTNKRYCHSGSTGGKVDDSEPPGMKFTGIRERSFSAIPFFVFERFRNKHYDAMLSWCKLVPGLSRFHTTLREYLALPNTWARISPIQKMEYYHNYVEEANKSFLRRSWAAACNFFPSEIYFRNHFHLAGHFQWSHDISRMAAICSFLHIAPHIAVLRWSFFTCKRGSLLTRGPQLENSSTFHNHS